MQGNEGMAISETDVDSLGLVSLSYGNQGVNSDLVVESACISSNGTVDCTGETVQAGNASNDFVLCCRTIRLFAAHSKPVVFAG